MSELPLAILTVIVIVAVFAATQPSAPGSRRRAPAPKRPRAEAPTRTRPRAAQNRLDDTHRNRWTRTDLALAIGRDHAAAELDLLAWPTPEAQCSAAQ